MKTKLILSLSVLLIYSARAQVQVLPPDFALFGKTSGEYLAELDQVLLPFTTNGDYLLPKAVPSAAGPVYFLQRPFFVPIIHFAFDNVGNAIIMTPAELRDQLDSVLDTVTNVHATIDGVALTNVHAMIDGVELTNLLDYRTESPVFSIFFPTNDNIYTVYQGGVPYEGLDDPVVAGGFPLMLAPLSVGLHDFRTGAAVGGVNNFQIERHYQIHVFHTNHPPVADASATRSRVISPDNLSATVVLDGSRSSDRDNDPLTYAWLEGNSVLSMSVVSTNVLSVGTHVISLVVSDGKLSSTNTVTVEVLTPCEALGELAGTVEAAKLPKRDAKPLAEELRDACAAFEHGLNARHHDRQEHLKHAVHELREFQREVREELGRVNPALAALLIDGAQEIIDAVKPAPKRHHEEGDGDEDDRV